jgi:DNA-binding NtrC family response regulator
MSEEQLAVELFGIEADEGARSGAVEAADGGALLLENIESLPAALEPRLAHALDYGQVYRAGSISPRRARVRFVATARRRPEGRDLLRKIAGAVVEVPPLRARPADIEPLARSFASGSQLEFAPETLAALRGCAWPGNVAELRLAVDRAVALASGGRIEPHDLDLPAPASSADQTLRVGVAALERDRIEAALTLSGGNRSRAARALGIARNTLLARIKAFGL